MQLKRNRIFVLAFVFLFLASLFPLPAEADAIPESKIIITEIRLGGNEIQQGKKAYKEYLTLFNVTDETINLQDWSIEYAKNNFSEASCGLPSWTGDEDGYKTEFDGTIPPKGVSSVVRQLNDSGSGSIRVVEEQDTSIIIHDLVGWGEDAPCYENSTAVSPENGTSIKRYIDCTLGNVVDTNNNSLDFGISSNPTPQAVFFPDDQAQYCGATDNNQDEDDGEDQTGGMGADSDTTGLNSCNGIIVTEILPNPSGSDSGNEFIELYNPTSSPISLEGCKLQTTSGSKMYTFGNKKLQPDQYIAFYNDLTGLTLSNSSGGSVYLVNTDDSEQEKEYPPDLEDDVAWALELSSGKWSTTYKPTPGSGNQIIEFQPCPNGQFRNHATNRCNKIAVEAGLGSCPAGKFRNPETNRCKSLLDSTSLLKACSAGQFRNPETNRCKSLGSSSTLVPCKPNQKRNPETNRCRKTTDTDSISGGDSVKDVLSVSDAQNQTSWTMAGFSFAGASVYAAWEWRSEMMEKLLSLKGKLGIK